MEGRFRERIRELLLSQAGGPSADAQEVYYIPEFEGQGSYKVSHEISRDSSALNWQAVDIASTSMSSVVWHTPSIEAYPEGTTL